MGGKSEEEESPKLKCAFARGDWRRGRAHISQQRKRSGAKRGGRTQHEGGSHKADARSVGESAPHFAEPALSTFTVQRTRACAEVPLPPSWA